MKLKFKKQQYQEDASLSVVKCFEGQPKAIRQDLIGRREKKIDLTNLNQSSVEDIISFCNNRIMPAGVPLVPEYRRCREKR